MNTEIEKHLKPVRDAMDYNLYGSASVGKLLDSWGKNKKHFFSQFGDKNIISTEDISLDFDNESEINRGYVEFRNKARDYFEDKFILESFLEFFRMSVGKSGFKNNTVNYDWDSASLEFIENEDRMVSDNVKPKIKINKGMKFARSLRNFFDLKGENKEIEEEKLKELQDLYSTYRQTFSSKKSGKVFLSMHPLDYLSISDNNHNWSSCHSMYEGEHRVGNLNFMADGVTLVGYYASDDDFDEQLEILPDTPWNSKRWRVLVHLQYLDGKLNVIYNKQYPFKSTKLIKELDNLIVNTYNEAAPSEFLTYEDERIQFKRLYRESYDSCAYLDIGRSGSCFVRLAEEYLEEENEPKEPMQICAPVYCVECGQNIADRGDTGHCDQCSDEWYCEDCDGNYYQDDMVYVDSEDRYVCYDCYETFHAECPECGEECGSNNMRYLEMLGRDICPRCWEDIEDSEGTLIFSFNDMSNQLIQNHTNAENIKKMYCEIEKEETKLVKLHKKKDRTVWLTTIYTEIDPRVHQELEMTERAELRSTQMNYVYLNSTRVVRSNLVWGSPFKRLENLSMEVPMIKDIILMGSTTQGELDENLTELNISLQALGIKQEVNLDYTRVRII